MFIPRILQFSAWPNGSTNCVITVRLEVKKGHGSIPCLCHRSFCIVLRRNPPDVGVTSGQKPCSKITYIVLQTSVGL